MSDQDLTQPPPPPPVPGQSAPQPSPAAQEPYVDPAQAAQQQAYGAPGQAPKKSSKTLWIVLGIVLVLLLCCCFGFAGFMALGWYGSESQDDSPSEPVTITEPEPADTRTEKWESFQPTLQGSSLVEPDERQTRIAQEVIAAQLPDFVIEEVRVAPGSYDAEQDSYIADLYVVRGSAASDPDVALGWPFHAATVEWEENGVTYDEDSLGESEVLGTLADGTQYSYWVDAIPSLSDGAGEEYLSLLGQVAADWPDAVITDAFWDAELASWVVYVTTWEAFLDDAEFEGFAAEYADEDGTWVIEQWDSVAY